MTFNPEQPPSRKSTSPTIAVHVYGPDGEVFRTRVDAAAMKCGLSTSKFCRQAIEYALDHMEE